MPPTASKVLQVRDRIVEVLKAIRAGANYNFTAYEVRKGFVDPAEALGFPIYWVVMSHCDPPVYAGERQYDYFVYYTIGVIVDDLEDTSTKLDQCRQDIQRAIDEDSRGTAAGQLCVLTVQTNVQEWTTDNGVLILEGKGFLEQTIRCQITGDFGEI